jgi:hypothetical protein
VRIGGFERRALRHRARVGRDCPLHLFAFPLLSPNRSGFRICRALVIISLL